MSTCKEGCSKAYPVLEDQRQKLFEHVVLMNVLYICSSKLDIFITAAMHYVNITHTQIKTFSFAKRHKLNVNGLSHFL